MEVIQFFIDLLRDPRGFIAQWIIELGPVWVYTPLFLIIFVETGLVVTPFLPGDSLLFCAASSRPTVAVSTSSCLSSS